MFVFYLVLGARGAGRCVGLMRSTRGVYPSSADSLILASNAQDIKSYQLLLTEVHTNFGQGLNQRGQGGNRILPYVTTVLLLDSVQACMRERSTLCKVITGMLCLP